MTDVASVARSPANNRIPGESSMWFFVIGDLIIFGGYFLAYVWYRGQQPEVFLAGQARVNLGIGVANTIVLLTSSLFVALGTAAARAARTAEALRLFVIALILGAAFPVLKLSEYVPEILAGNTPGTNLFFMYYFVMTGLHLCHVMLGLVILSFVIRDLNGSAAPRMSLIETGATYWHMVDVLWIVLFALLYVMR
ncbi:cytochrome c oxidase subunit 3 [Mycolicibacterium bacteremicum]|uniref:Probable cytochrome c oxidase subunit 3 n=2 Tax=Mycolicibacterium bacteremicum TaxID=564198 RepID=A0A1W9YZ17_MYCBA|nr:cytochrome c oxidase subunit 3 [Mycolicibacterium bacteremicum]MCV7431398.1 cytochrome c oxidase subunit 3 [Mycolicibacterium bacteremicum]ORA05162.1 cytochrome C oxidase subunit III [Mycolicibacterium bacteremicum]